MKLLIGLMGLSLLPLTALGLDCEAHKGQMVDATVLSVSDGDTAKFSTKSGDVVIRYWGVDTPEKAVEGRWPEQPYS